MTSYQLGLLGYPLGHSFSPRLHQAALRGADLAGRYELFPIHPGQFNREVRILLERLRNGEIRGLNVTVPYKQAVIPYLDELLPTASAIGAVNTILARDGLLIGENFDCPAFLADLAGQMSRARVRRAGHALVLGAGGAARAVVHGLLQTGWQVNLAARRLEQAEELACAFHQPRGLVTWQLNHLADDDLAGMHLIVNATPLGMYPHPVASAWPGGLPLPAGALLYDLVYNPPETVLMAAGRAAGLSACNGLGMLARQAAFSFAAWTGQTVSWQVICQALPGDSVPIDGNPQPLPAERND